MGILSLLLSTIILRPYVFMLLLMHLISGGLQLGPRRIVVFTLLGYWIAFASEYSSTRVGIPYGMYIYTGATHGKELYVSNVPFMDSLSYAFLAYFSYSLAILVTSQLYRNGFDVQLVRDKERWRSGGVLILAAIFMVLQDIVVDPVALRGSAWFLGQIFYYPDAGIYFGVPLSNFFGWLVVALAIIYSFQRFDRLVDGWPGFRDEGSRYAPGKAVLGTCCYFATMLFNLFITFYIGEYLLGLVSLVIVVILLYIVRACILVAIRVDRSELERIAASSAPL
ncbi:MAG TPA: carotenoid biosynthesis protein [Candidatus Avalokitesvara rifleensis]|uniref:carotenoid biosynthesis protein n=1 Tax=Candidatus Avalokitesvara rifleensis TaxID=3367620 RepID=UPI002712E173|nr:carotenoid biosynthesis protein [Candidatus Brocadiales bacterium]